MSLRALFFAPVTRTRPVRAVAAGHLEALHPVTLSGARRMLGLGSRAMVRLTRIYTKTGDAGQTHLGRHEPGRQDRPAPGRLRRRGRGQQRPRRRAGARRAGAGDRRPAAQHPERPVRRRRRPVHPGHRRPGVPAAAGDRRLHRAARGGLRRVQRGAAEADQLHPARRHGRPRRCCTRRGSSPGGPSAACGPCWPPTPSAPTPRPPATSTGSRTCCSSWRGRRTRAATCCGSPARTAARTPSGRPGSD